MISSLFIALVIAAAAGYVAATHWSGIRLRVPAAKNFTQALLTAVAVGAILGLSMVVAGSGVLARFDRTPPYLLRFIAPHIMLAMILSRSPYGRRLAIGLPTAFLVGFQAFRIPVELLLHHLYGAGMIPVQMTFEGRNFDILTGLSAIPLAGLASRAQAPRWMLYLWNFLGLGLLINIVGTAIVSMPGPLRLFMNDPANTLIAHWPHIWLPTFLVPTALMGHLLLFRRLANERAANSASGAKTFTSSRSLARWE